MAVRALPLQPEEPLPPAAPAAEAAPVLAAPPLEILLSPLRHRWTRKELEAAWASNVFPPDAKLELIEGEVIAKMTQNAPHVACLRRTDRALDRVFGEGFDVRTQVPLNVGLNSQPEPDIAVVAGSIDDYEQEHPTTAVLVVEIADTSLAVDRLKCGLYAMAGVPEVWIVDLDNRAVEVYREPAQMAGQTYGCGYRSVQRFPEDQSVAPLAAPDHRLTVHDLLPRATSGAAE